MKLGRTVGVAFSAGLVLALVNCSGDDPEVGIDPDSGTASSSSSSSGEVGSSSGQQASSSSSGQVSSSSGDGGTGTTLTMAELFSRLRPAAQTGSFSVAAGKTIELPGVKFTIPPSSIYASTNGCDDFASTLAPAPARVTGDVTYEAIGYRTAGDMLRGDRPTVTKDGTWIESGGAFEIRVTAADGQRACIIDLRDIAFTAPAGVSSNEGMQLWLADSAKDAFEWKVPVVGSPVQRAGCDSMLDCQSRACANQISCRPFLCDGAQPACGVDMCLGTASCPARPECSGDNVCSGNAGGEASCAQSAECRISCRGKCDEARCANAPACAPVPINASGTPPEFLFNRSPFGRIGNYDAANCDRLYGLPGDKITVKVLFASNFSAESGVFFIPTGMNSAVKLYTALVGESGYTSYANSMPAGTAGKLIVVSLKDGKFYYEEQAITLAGAAGSTQTLTVNPVELSETDFEARLTAL